MDAPPLVERRFELGGDEVVARFYLPAKAPRGEFQCCWTIAWPDRERGFYTCGGDRVQPLLLAMRTVHSELVVSEAYQAGRLTLYGQADLDLPTWMSEPQQPPGPEI